MGQYFPADRMGRLMNVVRSAAFAQPTGKVYIISYSTSCKNLTIAQFAITMNSNVCPYIRVLNTLMRESYA